MGKMVVVENDSIRGVNPITPHDVTEVNKRYNHAVTASGAGNINIKFTDGTSAIFAFGAGDILKCEYTHILATSTTATGIVGLKLYR